MPIVEASPDMPLTLQCAPGRGETDGYLWCIEQTLYFKG